MYHKYKLICLYKGRLISNGIPLFVTASALQNLWLQYVHLHLCYILQSERLSASCSIVRSEMVCRHFM